MAVWLVPQQLPKKNFALEVQCFALQRWEFIRPFSGNIDNRKVTSIPNLWEKVRIEVALCFLCLHNRFRLKSFIRERCLPPFPGQAGISPERGANVEPVGWGGGAVLRWSIPNMQSRGRFKPPFWILCPGRGLTPGRNGTPCSHFGRGSVRFMILFFLIQPHVSF